LTTGQGKVVEGFFKEGKLFGLIKEEIVEEECFEEYLKRMKNKINCTVTKIENRPANRNSYIDFTQIIRIKK